MISLSLAAVAGSLVLLAVETTVRTSEDAVDKTLAHGMAQQLIDEVMGSRYRAVGADPYQVSLGPNSWELQGDGRERFDDTDDFHNFVAEGAEDVFGLPLGTGDDGGGLRDPSFRVRNNYFANWQQSIEVYYVDDNNLAQRLSSGQTSSHRAVEVTIARREPDGSLRTLARLRRVYAYVPPPI